MRARYCQGSKGWRRPGEVPALAPAVRPRYRLRVATDLIWLEQGHGIALVGPTLIQLWEKIQPDAARMRRIGDRFRELAAAHPRVFMMTVVGEASPMPDAGAREVAAKFPEVFTYYVGVHEGSSFRMAIVRSVLVGMSMLSSTRARYDVTDSLEEGVRLLVTNARGDVEGPPVLAAVHRLREAVRELG
jgi:hypothetical protein